MARRQLVARIDRPRRLLHPHRGFPGERRRSVRLQQLVLAVRRRRPHVRRAVLGRRQSRHLVGSEKCRPLRHHARCRTEHHAAARAQHPARQSPDRPDVSRGRRQPDPVFRLQQHAGRRDDARRGVVGGKRRRRVQRPRQPMGARRRGVRVRLHHPRSAGRQHRLGVMLRKQSHAVRFAAESRPIGGAVDDHARRAAGGREIPLPLDGAARRRSVRSQHGLLRLPGDFRDEERRPELERDQSGSVDAGSGPHHLVGWHRFGQPRTICG